ncbi:MAG: hypothetical protein EZS28_031222, partial [Streblomastix strix]
MSEKKQQSSSSQGKCPSAYDEDRKALLVLAFMPQPEIETFLADQGFVPPTFDKDEPHFIEKLDSFKIYMIGKQMTYVDLIRRFSAMKIAFSKKEMQQKMIYAQMADSQEEQMRFFMDHGPRASLIANSKFGRSTALLPLPSAPPASTASNIDDTDAGFHTQQKKSANEQKYSFQSLRVVLVAQGLVNIIKHIQEGASTGDTVYQPPTQVIIVALDHREETSSIVDIITTSTTTEMTNFGRKWPKWWEYKSLPKQIRWRYENLWSTTEPAVMQPSEASHAYVDCARAVLLEESALIAEIYHTKPDQPPSRYLIDAYLMCLTAGARLSSIRFVHLTQGQSRYQALINYRTAPAQGPSTYENAPYYGRRNNHRDRGHRQPNDNQR